MANTIPPQIAAMLVAAVKALSRDDAPARAAAVKQWLLRHDSTFDENTYGFSRFKFLLEAAEHDGLIALHRRSGVTDLEVTAAAATAAAATAAAVPERIRADLWNAFTRWETFQHRLWDTKDLRAYLLRHGDHSLDADLRLEPHRYIDVPAVSFDTVREWAGKFANLPKYQTHAATLLESLNQHLPVREFTQAVRNAHLLNEWQEFRATLVKETIGTWAAEHSIDPASIAAVATHNETPGDEDNDPERDLRSRLHRVLDEMTLPELMAIPVPVRLIVGNVW